VQESTATHVIVRLFALGRKRQDKFSHELRELAQTGTSAHIYVGLIGRSALIGTGFSQLIVIGIGGILAVNGYMTAGLLIAFIGLLLRIGDGVAQLSVSIPMFLPAVAARKRLDEFLAQNVASPENANAVSVGRLSGEIVFDDIVFGYDRENPILKNVSFSIRAGEAVAFVGPSGSGKSTVISLLLRVRRPDAGRILLDAHPLGDIAEESLRDNMSVVPQNAILFEATVRDNILVGRPDASEHDLMEAARAAHIHETVIAKPDGYDTIVSVSGGALSGGERQRVATARALLRDAPILLLDEATSALDPASEQVVNQSIARRVGRHTVVSVTHRLSSIVDFDRIFVMDGGRLVESGRHAELLEKRGLYCDLWEKQNGINLDIENGAPSVSAERLALIPFLSGCSMKTLSDLASLFVVEVFREGSDVFRQGDDGDKFYIVAHGRLEVRMNHPDEGEIVVATLVDGDVFGELALVKNQPRAATIRVVGDSWCLSLPRQHFLALLKTEDAVRANIAAAIAKFETK
jgi:ATP-binding cassette subfamily B protein